MELGETVCLPNTEPLCERCPVASLCLARQEGEPSRYPVRSAPKARRIEERTVLLLCSDHQYAIRRREEKGLLAGLWEFPSLDGVRSADDLAELFPEALSITASGSAKHIFSHVEWHMTGYLVLLPRPLPGYVWETADAIRESYSIPTAFKYYRNQL